MAKLIVELSKELHQELKKALLRQQTIKGMITDLVEEYLIHKENR